MRVYPPLFVGRCARRSFFTEQRNVSSVRELKGDISRAQSILHYLLPTWGSVILSSSGDISLTYIYCRDFTLICGVVIIVVFRDCFLCIWVIRWPRRRRVVALSRPLFLSHLLHLRCAYRSKDCPAKNIRVRDIGALDNLLSKSAWKRASAFLHFLEKENKNGLFLSANAAFAYLTIFRSSRAKLVRY